MKKFIKKYLFFIAFVLTTVTDKGVTYLFQINSPFSSIVQLIIFCIISFILLMYFGENSYHTCIEAKDEEEHRKIIRIFNTIGIILFIIILFFMVTGILSHFDFI